MSLILSGLIDFIYPKKCVGCGKNDVLLCDSCLMDLEYADQICPGCGESSLVGWTHEVCKKKYGMDGLTAVYDFGDDEVKKIIGEIKFGFNRELVRTLVSSWKIELGIDFDLIVPVPLYYYRENWRGFNQAELIAKELVTGEKNVVLSCLRRVKQTKQQARIMDKVERKNNLKGVFEVEKGCKLRGKNVLLVDDVFTSGETMREATRELKKKGVVFVWGLVIGH